jgi:hypothetical protein
MPRSNSLPFLRRGSSRSCRRPTRLASRRAAKAITCRSAARPEPIRGAENAEIRCRIGAKSGAAFRRNHLPLSTEIRCRFAPIFADLRLERDQRAAAPQFAAVGVDQLIAKAEFQAHTPWHRLARQFSAKISKTQGVSKGKSALPQSFRRQFELAHTAEQLPSPPPDATGAPRAAQRKSGRGNRRGGRTPVRSAPPRSLRCQLSCPLWRIAVRHLSSRLTWGRGGAHVGAAACEVSPDTLT